MFASAAAQLLQSAPAPAPAAEPSAQAARDLVASLERLAALHAIGVLTDDELTRMKARIMAEHR